MLTRNLSIPICYSIPAKRRCGNVLGREARTTGAGTTVAERPFKGRVKSLQILWGFSPRGRSCRRLRYFNPNARTVSGSKTFFPSFFTTTEKLPE